MVGTDIGKDSLHLARSGSDEVTLLGHDEAGLHEVVRFCKDATLVLLEASGGFERDVLDTLHDHKLPVVCINPKQARDFARACGARAKTDNVDARRLALVGQRMIPQTQSAPDPAQIELKSLLMPSKATRQKSRCRKVSSHPTLSTLDGFGAATPHVVERRNRRA